MTLPVHLSRPLLTTPRNRVTKLSIKLRPALSQLYFLCSNLPRLLVKIPLLVNYLQIRLNNIYRPPQRLLGHITLAPKIKSYAHLHSSTPLHLSSKICGHARFNKHYHTSLLFPAIRNLRQLSPMQVQNSVIYFSRPYVVVDEKRTR